MNHRDIAIYILDEVNASNVTVNAVLDRVYAEVIKEALKEQGCVYRAAMYLGIGRTTLIEQMRKFEIKNPYDGQKINKPHHLRKKDYETT